MKIKYLLLAVLTSTLFSCSGFLDEYSQDLVYVKTAADLDEVLIGDGYMSNTLGTLQPSNSEFQFFGFLNVMDDDVERYVLSESATATINTEDHLDGAHFWQRNILDYEGVTVTDYSWIQTYKHINALNTILGAALKLEESDELDRVKGEAYFLRAYYYFMAVNVYGLPYSEENKSTLGVPLKLTDVIDPGFFKRNTVEECYTQIISDLDQAMLLLKDRDIKNVYRGSYVAASALLSKVYLYMQDYVKAEELASVAIENATQSLMTFAPNFSIYSYPNATTPAAYFLSQKNTGTIFSTGSNQLSATQFFSLSTGSYVINCYVPSDELLGLFQPGDQRYTQFGITKYQGARYFSVKGSNTGRDQISNICPIRLAEVYLNRAEARMALGKEDEAKEDLRNLFTYRYDAGSEPALTESGEALMTFVRDERRRETCFEGQRWFDIRRYAVATVYPSSKEIVHNKYSLAQDNYGDLLGSATLGTYDVDKAAYVLQIPKEVLDFNQGMQANPDRPDRPIQ